MSEKRIGDWLGGERVDRTDEVVNEVHDLLGDVTQSSGGSVRLEVRGMESEWRREEILGFLVEFQKALLRCRILAASD